MGRLPCMGNVLIEMWRSFSAKSEEQSLRHPNLLSCAAEVDEQSALLSVLLHLLPFAHSAALLPLPCNAGGERPLHEVDEHSSNARTVKAALCCGLYPQVGKGGLRHHQLAFATASRVQHDIYNRVTGHNTAPSSGAFSYNQHPVLSSPHPHSCCVWSTPPPSTLRCMAALLRWRTNRTRSSSLTGRGVSAHNGLFVSQGTLALCNLSGDWHPLGRSHAGRATAPTDPLH